MGGVCKQFGSDLFGVLFILSGAVKANKHGEIESKLAHVSFGPDQFRTQKRMFTFKNYTNWRPWRTFQIMNQGNITRNSQTPLQYQMLFTIPNNKFRLNWKRVSIQ